MAANGAVTVWYTNLQGSGSDIIESNGTVTWALMDDFRPGMLSFYDTTPSASYTVQWWGLAVNNGVTATCDNPGVPAPPTCTVDVDVNGAATVSYTNLQAFGSDIIESNGTITWQLMPDFRPGTLTFYDTTPSASYTVQYWGLAVNNGVTATCDNPNVPTGPTCSVEVAADGSATISYTNLQALGSDIIESNGTVTWDANPDFRPGVLSFYDATPSASYEVKYWGLAVNNGISATCDNPDPNPEITPFCYVVRGNTIATIYYSNLVAGGSDIIESNGTVTWAPANNIGVSTRVFTDTSPSASYSVAWWGLANNNGITANCSEEPI